MNCISYDKWGGQLRQMGRLVATNGAVSYDKWGGAILVAVDKSVTTNGASEATSDGFLIACRNGVIVRG
jgi:hypothetical protein